MQILQSAFMAFDIAILVLIIKYFYRSKSYVLATIFAIAAVIIFIMALRIAII